MADHDEEKSASRILIAEDEAILAEDIGISLENLGYLVAGKASSGEDAVKLARESKPDLILMDIKLQGDIEGIEAADRIRTFLDIPVVYLTGYSEKDVLERAKKTEPYGYLGKPVSLTELRTTIETALYKHSTDKRIKESEQKYRDLVETVTHGMGEIDSDGTITFSNQAYARMHGYTVQEMTGKSILDLQASQSNGHEIIDYLHTLVRDQPTPTPWFSKQLTKDGALIDVRVDWNYKRDDQGAVVGFISVITDITDRIKAEEALSEVTENLAEAQRVAKIGNWTRDVFTDKLIWSDEIYRIFEMEKHDIQPDFGLFLSRVHPDDRTKVVEALTNVSNLGGAFEIEYRIIVPSGHIKTIRGVGYAAQDNGGNVVRLFGTAQDISDLKKAKDELRESERKYRDVFDGAPIGIFQSTIDGKLLSLNPAYAMMHGYASIEEAEREIDNVAEQLYVEPERRKMLIDAALKTDGFVKAEVHYRKRDGSTFWGELYFRVVRDRAGDVKHLEGFIGDISERRKAEEAIRMAKSELQDLVKNRTRELVAMNKALQESQSTLRLITDSLPVLIAYVDSEQRYLFCNKTYELWRGLPRKEIEGKHMWEILAETAYERARPHIEAALSGTLADYEMRAFYEDGKDRYLHVIYVPHVDETGATKGFAGLITDITERKRMEEALRDSRDELEQKVMERTAEFCVVNQELKREIVSRRHAEKELMYKTSLLTSLIESLPDVIYFKDAQRRHLLVNKAFEDFFGVRARDIIGKTIEVVVRSDRAEQSRKSDEVVIATKSPLIEEHSWVSQQGETCIFETRKFPIFDDQENIVAVGGISRDITERKKSAEQIKASLREKEVLVREIHHRVKNNLAVVQSLLRIQSHYVRNEELSQVLEEVRHRVRSMALGHELLYQSENLSDIRINQYFGNLLSQLKESFSIIGKRIGIRQEIEEIRLRIDTAVPLGFILTELISNCYKHAFPERSHGQIAVSLGYVGHENLELAVRDDGIGLPQDVDFEKPTSLGYHLIGIFGKQLNGDIKILSQKGTEVRISFPLK